MSHVMMMMIALLAVIIASSSHAAFVSVIVEPDAGSIDRSLPIGQMAQEPVTYLNPKQPAALLLEHGGDEEEEGEVGHVDYGTDAVKCKVRCDDGVITSYVAPADVERLCVNIDEIRERYRVGHLLQQSTGSGLGAARVISQAQVTVIVNGKRTVENRVRIFCSSDSPRLDITLPNATIAVRCLPPDDYFRAPVVGLVPAATQVARGRVRDSQISELAELAEQADDEQTDTMILKEDAKSAQRIEDYLGEGTLLLENANRELLQATTPGAVIPTATVPRVLTPERIDELRRKLEGTSSRGMTGDIIKGVSGGVTLLTALGTTIGLAATAGRSAFLFAGPVGLAVVGATTIVDIFFQQGSTDAVLELLTDLTKVVTSLTQVVRNVLDINRKQNEINVQLLTFASTVNERLNIVSTIANTNRDDIVALSGALEKFGRARVASYIQISDAVDQITGETANLARNLALLARQTSDTFNEVFKLIRFNYRTMGQIRTYIDHRVSERGLNAALLQIIHAQIDAFIAWNNRDPDTNAQARTEFALYGKFKMLMERGQWERIAQARPVNRGNPTQDNAFRNQPIIVAMSETMFSVKPATGSTLPRAKSLRVILRCTAGFWLDLPPDTPTIATIVEAVGGPECSPAVAITHDKCNCWFEVVEYSADQRVPGSILDTAEANPNLADTEVNPLYSVQQFLPASTAIVHGSVISTSSLFASMQAFENHMQTKCLQYFRAASADRIVQSTAAGTKAYRYTSITQLAFLDEVYPDSVWPQLDCGTALEGITLFINSDVDTQTPHYVNPFFARFFQGALLSWRLVSKLEAAELMVQYIGRLPGNTIYLNTVSEFQTSETDAAHTLGMVGSSLAERVKHSAVAFISSNTLAHRRFTHMETVSRVSITASDDSSVADAIVDNNVRITAVTTTSAHALPAAFDILGVLAVNDWLLSWHPDAPVHVCDVPQDAFGHGHTMRSRANKVNYFEMPPRRSLVDGRIVWHDDYNYEGVTPVYEPMDAGAFLAANYAGGNYIDPRDASYGPQDYMREIINTNHPSFLDGCLIYDSIRNRGVTPCSLRNSHYITQEVFGVDDRTHVFKFSPARWTSHVDLVLPVADFAEDLRSICPIFVDPRTGDPSLTSFGVFGKIGSHKIFLRNDNAEYTNTLRILYAQNLNASDPGSPNATAECNGETLVTLLPAEERFIDAGTSLCPYLTIRLSTYDGNPCNPIVGLSMATLVEFDDTWSYPPLDLIGGDLEAIATTIIRDAHRDVIQAVEFQIANFSALINERVAEFDRIIEGLQNISLASLPGDAEALNKIFQQVVTQVTNGTAEIARINQRFAFLRNASENALTDAWALVAEITADLNRLNPIVTGILQDLEVIRELASVRPSSIFDTSSFGSTLWSIIKWAVVGAVVFLLICFCISCCKGRAGIGGSVDAQSAKSSHRRQQKYEQDREVFPLLGNLRRRRDL